MRNYIVPCCLLYFSLFSRPAVCGSVEVAASPLLVVHGGAGSLSPEYYEGKLRGVKEAVRAGYKVLRETQSPLEAVEAAIKVMEDNPDFNAGRGSKLNIFGEVEMDASIMEGRTCEAGAVASVGGLRHPISAARHVMENTSHVLLVSRGAERLAARWGLEETGEDWLVTEHSRELLEEFLRQHNITHLQGEERWEAECLAQQTGSGTVGAVAYYGGEIAAGTSTGGITGKLPGRVGDSPLVGQGVFADNER